MRAGQLRNCTRSDKSCSHESQYPSRTGAAPEIPLVAMRPLHAVLREFPPADIFTAQALRTADPQINCVCAKCAYRAAAQVAPDTGPSAPEHTPGSRERLPSRELPRRLPLLPHLSGNVFYGKFSNCSTTLGQTPRQKIWAHNDDDYEEVKFRHKVTK